MNKTTEALKLAEEALQTLSFEDEHGFFTAYDVETQVTDLVEPALAAIREALAEQEKQEPIGWTHAANLVDDGYGHIFSVYSSEPAYDDWVPVYAAPVSVEAAIDWSNLKFQYHALQQIGGYWYDGPVRNQWIADNCHEMTKHIAAAIRSLK